MVGAFTANNRIFDMWVLFVVGVVGYMLIQSGLNVTPMVLGFILGRIVESNFRTAVISGHGSVMGLLHSPIAIAMIAFGVIVAIFFGKNRKNL